MGAFFTDNGFLIVSMVLAAALALSLYLPMMAGQLSLAGDSSPVPRRISQTLSFVQRASDCYSRCGYEGEMATARTRAISVVLEKSCPPA